MENFLAAIWKQLPLINNGITEQLVLGIVAKKSDNDESWRAYCGIVNVNAESTDMKQEQRDIETIIKHGTKLSEEEAMAWFPLIELKYAE